MTARRPWFRLYADLITDPKITRTCRKSGVPHAAIIGTWTTLLSLASQAPTPGTLQLTDTEPITFDDLIALTQLDDQTLKAILNQFTALDMITINNDIITITHWHERQFDSDNATSTSRVTKHRMKRCSNVSSATPQQNVTPPEQSQSRTESEQSQNRQQQQHARTETCPQPVDNPTAAAAVPEHPDPVKDSFRATADTARAVGALEDLGIDPQTRSQLADIADYSAILAWANYARNQPGLKNPAGYVIKMLKEHRPPPHNGNPPQTPTWFTQEEYDLFFVKPGDMPQPACAGTE